MILGFDIGNTSTLSGLYRDSPEPFEVFRFPTDRGADADSLLRFTEELTAKISGKERITKLVYSSVVPEVNHAYENLAGILQVPFVKVSGSSRLSVKLMYLNPSRLGADRIANAEAAFREYPGDSIIIDIGTAATFCVLHRDGTYDGGLIAPGINTCIKALAGCTSNLPEIVFEKPDRLVAVDTINALKSGFFYGWVSMVEGIISRIEKEYGLKFRVILTGGLSGHIAEALSGHVVLDRMLTMKGLKYICELNS